jgi:zinc protease
MLLAAVAGAVCAAWASAREERKIFPYPVNVETLENGLQIVGVPWDSPGIIAYYTVVRAGSRNEVEPGLSGFAHFFEHMMFRGTKRFSQEQYNDVVKKLGADSNAFTTTDWTCYHFVASSAALETLMDLESDRFQHLEYDEAGFQKEARAVLGEYNKNFALPIRSLQEKLFDTAFTTHPYKHTTMGFLKDIEDMPNQYEFSKKFFDRFYRPENCIVLVVGDFAWPRLVELARKYYGPWRRGTSTQEIPVEPEQKAPLEATVEWKNRTLPYLAIAWKGPAFTDRAKDLPALDLISQAAFGETSPLYRKLVLEEQRVDFIDGSASDQRDPHLFAVWTRVKKDADVAGVRDEVLRTVEELKTKPVEPARLKAIQSHLRYSLAMRLDSPGAVARTLAHFLNLTGDVESINRVYALYEQVTPEDLMALARKLFVPEHRTTATLRAAGEGGR